MGKGDLLAEIKGGHVLQVKVQYVGKGGGKSPLPEPEPTPSKGKRPLKARRNK